MTVERLTGVYSTFVRGFLERVQVHLDSLRHSGQKGTASERAVEELLLSFLPKLYAVEHDVVLVGTDHNLSPQCDLAIIDEFYVPRMFPMQGAQMWPVDSCGSVIEVKSRLRKQDLIQAIEHSAAIKRMHYNRTEVVRRVPQFESGLGVAMTIPPMHVVWAWQSDCESIETVMSWLKECLTGRVYNELPDHIFVADKTVFLSKTFTWMENSDVEVSIAEAPEEPFQCGIFRASEEAPADCECKEDSGGKHIAKLSQGRAVLNVLWSLVTQLGQRRQRQVFDASAYMPEEIYHFSEAPFKFYMSAGGE